MLRHLVLYNPVEHFTCAVTISDQQLMVPQRLCTSEWSACTAHCQPIAVIHWDLSEHTKVKQFPSTDALTVLHDPCPISTPSPVTRPVVNRASTAPVATCHPSSTTVPARSGTGAHANLEIQSLRTRFALCAATLHAGSLLAV